MLKKYFKLITGGREEESPAPPVVSEPEVPVIDATTVLDAATRLANGQPGEMLKRFLGRQPVLDASSQIVGYELKLRDKCLLPEDAEEDAVRRIQDEMLVISVIDLDFQKALGNKLTFISLAPGMLNNPLIEELPRHKVVVCVRLPRAFDPLLLERCRALVAMGIVLAIDDFEYRDEYEPFFPFCAFARMDTARFDALTLGQHAGKLQGRGLPLRLIAANVETEDAFAAYRKLAFDLFQGYYFARMQPNAPQRLDSDRMRVIELLNMVMNHAEIPDLEEKVKLDPGLSYKLLNFINSPANGLQQKIRSIGHALTLLGYDQLYRWLTLLLFSCGKGDGRNRTLLKSALVRGRFTEILGASRFAPSDQGGLFMVGVFSLLDVLLNVPMAQAIARLSLPQPVVDALLHRAGMYAPYLQLAIACEDFNQDVIAHCAATCGLSADEVNVTHVKALIWSEEVEV